jgi:hypothetical protein
VTELLGGGRLGQQEKAFMINELSDFLGSLTKTVKSGTRVVKVGKRAMRNLEKLDDEQRASLGKAAIGKALEHVAGTLAGPDIFVTSGSGSESDEG